MNPASSSGTLGLRDRLTKVFAEQPRVPSLLEEIPAGPGGHDLWLEQKAQNEAQTRVLRVDRVLGALGWSIVAAGGTANLAVEVSVRPSGSRFKRRLDYFGFDSADRRALLVVETKSPGLDLPVTDQHAYPESHPMVQLVRAWVAGHQNPETPLNKDWNDALGQLRDYVADVHRRGGGLARALLTNGHWWIVILDPLTALAPSPQDTPLELIRVYESPDRLLDHAKDFGALLMYSALASATEPVFIDQIPFCVDSERIAGMSFGLRVMHVVDITSWNREVPRLEVAPVVVLHSQDGGRLLVVGEDTDVVVPGTRPTKLLQHLQVIDRRANSLRRDIEAVLGRTLPPPRPIEHVFTNERFESLPAVVHRSSNPAQPHVRRFFVETGQHTHFMVNSPQYAQCPGHRFDELNAKNRSALRSAVVAPSAEAMTVITDSSPFHCADAAVHRVKSGGVTEENRDRCGPRSAEVFCEVAGFERHLCCRTCAFVQVCAKARCFAGAASRCVPLTVGAKSRRR